MNRVLENVNEMVENLKYIQLAITEYMCMFWYSTLLFRGGSGGGGHSGRFGGEDGGQVDCVGNGGGKGKGADLGPNAVES